jgi:uncharacterized protein with HEPN domain
MKLIGITAEQAEANRIEEAGKQVRAERDHIMKEVFDTYNAARWEEMTEVERQCIRDYRQALKNVPQQLGFPDSIIWPTTP